MSRPELKFELDEYGRIVYRVTDEGVLLSKDEKEFIIDHVTRMQAENAKLREQIHWLKKGDILHVLTDQEFAEQQKHEREMQASIKALDDENAKLRELVRTFYHCTTSGECDECPINGGGPVHLMPDTICDTIHDRMRELGVDA